MSFLEPNLYVVIVSLFENFSRNVGVVRYLVEKCDVNRIPLIFVISHIMFVLFDDIGLSFDPAVLLSL